MVRRDRAIGIGESGSNISNISNISKQKMGRINRLGRSSYDRDSDNSRFSYGASSSASICLSASTIKASK
jgi:hypothetical protein